MLRKALLCLLLISVSAHSATVTKAIRFGKLWDGHKVITNAVVIVDDDKVTSVTSNGKIPAGAQVIDMSRYTGIPGMIDAHTHMTYYWDHAPDTTPRSRPAKPRSGAVT